MTFKLEASQMHFKYKPDGEEEIKIIYVQNEDQEYVQIKRPIDESAITYDVPLIHHISDHIRNLSRKTSSLASKRHLPKPDIKDHRMDSPETETPSTDEYTSEADKTTKKVADSMINYDNNVRPIESLTNNRKETSEVKVVNAEELM